MEESSMMSDIKLLIDKLCVLCSSIAVDYLEHSSCRKARSGKAKLWSCDSIITFWLIGFPSAFSD